MAAIPTARNGRKCRKCIRLSGGGKRESPPPLLHCNLDPILSVVSESELSSLVLVDCVELMLSTNSSSASTFLSIFFRAIFTRTTHSIRGTLSLDTSTTLASEVLSFVCKWFALFSFSGNFRTLGCTHKKNKRFKIKLKAKINFYFLTCLHGCIRDLWLTDAGGDSSSALCWLCEADTLEELIRMIDTNYWAKTVSKLTLSNRFPLNYELKEQMYEFTSQTVSFNNFEQLGCCGPWPAANSQSAKNTATTRNSLRNIIVLTNDSGSFDSKKWFV